VTTNTATAASRGLGIPISRASFAEREGRTLPKAPVRIVHLGLGAFARAHQAWYTARADSSNEWGIAAFTGRRATAADELAPQDGLYSLIERSPDSDSIGIVGSIVEAWDGARLDRLVPLLAAPTTAIVTLTVTEPGYRLTSAGSPDFADPSVSADVDWLRATFATVSASGPVGVPAPGDGPQTALGRLLLGLDARRRAGGGPIALVPCDNIPDNGPFVRGGLLTLAAATVPETADWIAANVSFVSTSVDRITPKTTEADIVTVLEQTGWLDAAPVVTEPFSDWVLSGDFPAGRPEWERAGARFVDEIEPFERRKLWLLNGSHSLLAYAGRLRGHETVAAAIADPVCRGEVLELWNEAARHLPEGLDLESYTAALLSRFGNARIEHRLAQIGGEGVAKVRVRFVPVALAERAAGRSAAACATAIGAWVALVTGGAELVDAQRDAVVEARSMADPERALVALLDERLAADREFVEAVRAASRLHTGADRGVATDCQFEERVVD
jgi:fructuronate reductase